MSATPDPALPDSGMATGNDEGEPGEQSRAPLTPEEQQQLAALQQPADGEAEPAVEDGPEVAAAVADDAPLPGTGGPPDGLTPEFTDR
ncbi:MULTISPECIES: hypothetical protein [unclassified Modestobacter]|uniref:hypothetical protein n=1 Tax=unclassified Modestobacter TaxID=2643866 RepID=UPI0022AA2D86|nr:MULTISPECIES: hypothetical protein [unclassified Modestobacter]MCZ2824414.1 hypothetical protein [Modestobacter sp. VKM Ac-2981]MCZ2854058.1 hypothetical protein [Modestobacter sp. VKM Ac-2982]